MTKRAKDRFLSEGQCGPRSARSPSGPGGKGKVRTHRTLIVGICLVIVTLVTYLPLLRNDFILVDDRTYVTENPIVLRGLTLQGVAWAFTATHGSNWHPLTWLSHMLDCELFGTAAWGHHLANLLLHAANVALLFAFLLRATGQLWASAFVAALFGLHPLHVESVAWVAERKDVLSTFFGFLCLLAYERYARQPRTAQYSAVALLLTLGLASKPMLVTWPCVMLLLDYWPLRRLENGRTPRRLVGLLVEKLPLFALVALSCAVTVYAQRRGGAVVAAELVPWVPRVSNALLSYVWYLKATFWPSGLAIYYPHSYGAADSWATLGAAVLVGVVTMLALWFRRQRPYLIVGWLWYLGTLVPVIGLVQVGSQARADRYTYIPLIGISIILAWALKGIASRTRLPGMWLSPACIASLALLAVATWMQVGRWRDSITLFEYTLDVTSDNAAVHGFLGQTLYRQGRRRKAIEQYEKAVRLQPADFGLAYNFGLVLYLEGEIDRAVTQFTDLVNRIPQSALAHFHLGGSLVAQGQYEEAMEHSTKALQLNPKLQRAHLHLGIALVGTGRFDEAVTHLQR